MIPIAKNISVVDEQGNEYETTYPRRARGLVKNGRARFISDNKICLACPPDIDLEDNQMTEALNKTDNVINIGADELKTEKAENTVTYYLLKQVEGIASHTDYLHEVISELSKMPNGDSGEFGCPGNTMGTAKANALGDVVRSRETTNQQLLQFYEMLYKDLREQA